MPMYHMYHILNFQSLGNLCLNRVAMKRRNVYLLLDDGQWMVEGGVLSLKDRQIFKQSIL